MLFQVSDFRVPRRSAYNFHRGTFFSTRNRSIECSLKKHRTNKKVSVYMGFYIFCIILYGTSRTSERRRWDYTTGTWNSRGTRTEIYRRRRPNPVFATLRVGKYCASVP